MTAAPSVLLAIAKELAEQARSSLQETSEDEIVLREWYENGIFHRETALNGIIFHDQYDFRQRKSHRAAVN